VSCEGQLVGTQIGGGRNCHGELGNVRWGKLLGVECPGKCSGAKCSVGEFLGRITVGEQMSWENFGEEKKSEFLNVRLGERPDSPAGSEDSAYIMIYATMVNTQAHTDRQLLTGCTTGSIS